MQVLIDLSLVNLSVMYTEAGFEISPQSVRNLFRTKMTAQYCTETSTVMYVLTAFHRPFLPGLRAG